ncbi:MAG: Penicillin binding protein transpeptidase domain protein [candidate division WS6 bacterium OLB20]|uniref:beta-lactamase n=1 Tax=candidate division WS6 bacterium OLB20 TaxID=1617426 RepID=A0A136LYD1_9BACT|nr:MAG: Penicillin binding protein transpeptidase domain protein [candidate division WS6 bacterium OLB20]
MTSAIANGGKIVKPHLVSRIETPTGQTVRVFEPEVVRTLDVSRSTIDTVREGMRAAAVTGTAQGLGQLDSSIIAKTGSADAGEYIQGVYYRGAHSWITGCFDHDNENYCFTVMQQWGGRGYKTVPIMNKFINCVYNDFAPACEN